MNACVWPGCLASRKRAQLLCYPHWVSLPLHLQERIWQHYMPGQTALTCSPEYRAARRDVLAYAREQVTR